MLALLDFLAAPVRFELPSRTVAAVAVLITDALPIVLLELLCVNERSFAPDVEPLIAGLWLALCAYEGEDMVETGLATWTADIAGESPAVVEDVDRDGTAGREEGEAADVFTLRCRATEPDREREPEPAPEPEFDADAELGMLLAAVLAAGGRGREDECNLERGGSSGSPYRVRGYGACGTRSRRSHQKSGAVVLA